MEKKSCKKITMPKCVRWEYGKKNKLTTFKGKDSRRVYETTLKINDLAPIYQITHKGLYRYEDIKKLISDFFVKSEKVLVDLRVMHYNSNEKFKRTLNHIVKGNIIPVTDNKLKIDGKFFIDTELLSLIKRKEQRKLPFRYMVPRKHKRNREAQPKRKRKRKRSKKSGTSKQKKDC